MTEAVADKRSGSPAEEVLQRLRRFLLLLAIALFAGALAELWLVGHTEDPIQLIPFLLAIIAIVVSLLVYFWRSTGAIQVMRVWMVIVMLGTLLGIYLHVEGNVAFEREVNPKAPTSQLVWQGLGGGNPLLAPGILTVAALLAMAATYRSRQND